MKEGRWSLLSPLEAIQQLKSNEQEGLGGREVKHRQAKYGANILIEDGERWFALRIFLSQFKSPLLYILLLAGLVSYAIGEKNDAFIIVLTAVLNAGIGFFQEYKAGRALEKLRQLVTYSSVVLRAGEKKKIPSRELVPGDIVFLEVGNFVPADGRVVNSVELEVNEAPLTGESEPVKKQSRVLSKEGVVAEQNNMVWRGTTIVSGRATVIVTTIGTKTQIGQIASLVSTTKEYPTPLQVQLGQVSRTMAVLVVGISFTIFVLGIFLPTHSYTLLELFTVAVALAVAAIPEGLIVSLTVILAIGMQRILKRQALVRKLVAAETLGSVSVICTDKTGTLTEGVMKVIRLITFMHDLADKDFSLLSTETEETYRDALFAFKMAAICNNAERQITGEGRELWVGNSTDTALAQASFQVGFLKGELEKVFVRRGEIPFNSKQKYMVTFHALDGESFVCVKGAPEIVFPFVKNVEINGKEEPFSVEKQAYFFHKIQACTEKGLRVIAVAYKKVPSENLRMERNELQNLTLLAVVALSDPLRPDVKEVIAVCSQAGIRVVMITGDHAKTAGFIGRSLGLPSQPANIVLGSDLQNMSDKELKKKIASISIFARVDPAQKIRIVRAFQEQGEVVAMTGDGVNDSPALKGADIGIAVGSGTDIAKDIADVVLLDNRFTTIVSAIEEGRKIYQNIKKVLLYLFSFSLAEVLIVCGSMLSGFPLAVLPVQILWINLVQDSLPAIALAFEKVNHKSMAQKPRSKFESLFDSTMKIIIVSMTLISNALLFVIFLLYIKSGASLEFVRTMIFAGLGVGSFFFVYSVRSLYDPIWTVHPFGNKFLNVAVMVGFFLLGGAMYIPWLQRLLHTVPLRSFDWLVLGFFGLLNLLCVEIVKFFVSARQKKSPEDLTNQSAGV